MATLYWIGSGAGNWADVDNWSLIDGGGSAGEFPQVGDDAIFTSNDNTNCKVTAADACDSVTSTASFSGALDLTNDSLTVSGDVTFQDGELDLGSGTLTVGGNVDLTGATVTRGTGTLVMSGAAKTLDCDVLESLTNLTISGTVTLNDILLVEATTNVTGTLSIADGKLLRCGASGTVTLGVAGTIQAAGTTGYLQTWGSTTGIDTTNGTISCRVQFRYGGPLKARTYGDDVEAYFSGAQTVTASAGTLSIGANLEINQTGAGNGTLDCAANDPTVNVDGYIDFTGVGAGDEVLLAGDGNWNVAGNINFTGGTFTPAASEVILDGGAAQTITSDTESFNDLTITNTTASPGVTFADNVAATTMLKCITSDVTLTFTNGITGTFADINLDGQDANYVTLRPSAGAAYFWVVGADPQTDVSYVSVSYCDATGGQTIDASNGTNNDGGNNDGWTWPGGDKDVPIGAALTMTGAVQATTPAVTHLPSEQALTGAIAGAPVPDVRHLPAALTGTGAVYAPTILADCAVAIGAALGLTGGQETPVPTVFHLPSAQALTGAEQAPVPVVFHLPSAQTMTGAQPAPVPAVTHLPSALGMTGALGTPTPEARVLASALTIAAALETLTPAVLVGPAAIALVGALPAPTPEVRQLAATLTLTGAVSATTPEVAHLAAALAITLATQAPTVDIEGVVAALLVILGEDDLYI